MITVRPSYIDRFCQILVLFFIILCLFDFLSGKNLAAPYHFELIFIANTLLLGNLHGSFTLFLFLKYKPLKSWFKEKSLISNLILNWATVFLFLFVLEWWLNEMPQKLNNFFQFLIICYAYNHAISQTFGISLINNGLEKKRNYYFTQSVQEKVESAERWLFKLIIFFSFYVTFVSKFFASHSVILYINNSVYMAITTLGYIAFIYYYRKKTKTQNWTKAFFLIRLFLYPLVGFSYLGFIGFTCVHALEYLSVCLRIRKKSNDEQFESSRFHNVLAYTYLLAFFGCLTIAGDGGLRALMYKDNLPAYVDLIWFKILKTFLLSLGLFHYHLDGQIFKMRHKESRENILSALSS